MPRGLIPSQGHPSARFEGLGQTARHDEAPEQGGPLGAASVPRKKALALAPAFRPFRCDRCASL
jgi:hypothetical protein